MKQKPLSPKEYLKTNHAKLTFETCKINDNWQQTGMPIVVVQKKMPSGNFIIGTYLIDIKCLGLKNTFFAFNLSDIRVEEFFKELSLQHNLIDCDLVFAHNLVYGAIDYAQELGFEPNHDFAHTELLLDPDLIDDGIDEIEFGKDGKPLYIPGPNDNVNKILAQLERVCGTGNYHYITHMFD